jgi:hypothetical protein
MDEVLLGFDARERWMTRLREAGSFGGRPESFLLRADLEDVFSADRMVWPSIFAETVTLRLGLKEGLPMPEWIGMNAPFWENLSVFLDHLPSGELEREHPYWLIAATWHTDIGFDRELGQRGKISGPFLSPTEPEKRNPAWQLLGFDIADPCTSGLSNGGYSAAELPRLRAE